MNTEAFAITPDTNAEPVSNGTKPCSVKGLRNIPSVVPFPGVTERLQQLLDGLNLIYTERDQGRFSVPVD